MWALRLESVHGNWPRGGTGPSPRGVLSGPGPGAGAGLWGGTGGWSLGLFLWFTPGLFLCFTPLVAGQAAALGSLLSQPRVRSTGRALPTPTILGFQAAAAWQPFSWNFLLWPKVILSTFLFSIKHEEHDWNIKKMSWVLLSIWFRHLACEWLSAAQ